MNDHTAVITGASRGLGATVADFLASLGYHLIVTARGEEALGQAAARFAAHGSRVVSIAGDVADPGHRERLAGAVAEAGRLDLLINNASTLGPTPLPPLDAFPIDALDRLFAVNVAAPLALVQRLLPSMRAQGTGRGGLIVNISSDAARGGYPGWGGYGATKASLDLVSRTLATELQSREVAVVSVDPGDLRTAMHQRAFPGQDISDRPSPEVTLPFWAWLLGQDRMAISGRRFAAQSDRWEAAA